MGRTKQEGMPLPIKVYQRVETCVSEPDANTKADLLVKFRVFLKDRPGSLAALSSLIAQCRGNINFFHYDRSQDSSRVVIEVQMPCRPDLDALIASLVKKHYSFEKANVLKDEVQITDPESILEIRVGLLNKPGSLAAFAGLLTKHQANIIHMFYDEDIDPESADVGLAAQSAEEIDRLMDVLNKEGHNYRVVYRGSDEKEVKHIIGLKLVEKFFLRLSKLLDEKDRRAVKELVDSSQELHADLVRFYSEAGNNLETSDVFEKVLALASMSRRKLGERFSVVEMPSLLLDNHVRLYSFRLPTSENIYVFHHGDEMTMIDAGYGVYYKDIKALLLRKGMDPAQVRRIFVTHCDADHIGTAGLFEKEFGTEIFIHPAGKGIVRDGNRAHGTSGKLLTLNKYYSRLVNKFTDCTFPGKARYFSTSATGRVGAFAIIDTFSIGPLDFLVLESHGGHIPGHVFFLNKSHGLFFTSDYLINVKSLSSEEKNNLGIYKYLLISPNSDSLIFKEEVSALKEIIAVLDADLGQHSRFLRVLPGHGDYYRACADQGNHGQPSS